ncbi:N-acetyltransferase [Vibrio sp. MACH09]|uniref:GNAT family N-acetyltransferase n=1 Tax=unclassified Vibrio TaxID=2614977 RepID=UPI0014934102|nr:MULTISPECIES: GNAT family N-acetyltransferase [unclassified Vibrio]NOI67380.1 GNAT family N-acetyltransferase [Vibrio sp. 99-8-1]GLO63939.1 N-acetyltransferase [Vibrio sp. MACH09]
MDISVTHSPKNEEIACIYDGLSEFNHKNIPQIEDNSFAIFVRDKTGNIVGGLTGAIYLTSVQIKYLWLSETLRNKGVGGELMHRVEQECRTRNIKNIAVNTYSFQAPLFYQSQGFKEIGRYEDYLDKGIDKIFYLKHL